MALALLTAPAPRAERVSVVVVPDFSPAEYAGRGAVGLFVPGEGKRVSREAALASLVRGKVENSIVGGVPGGRPLIAPGRRPADVTIYVALPPTGSQPNDRRYPIAVVGGGYHGLLTSGSTRLDGLVSIADIAPTARSLERGERPAIRWRASEHAARALARLDRRLDRNRDTRIPAMLVLALGTLAGCVIALLVSTRYAGRAAQLAAPATLLASLVVSAAAITTPWLVILLIPLFAAAASLAAAAWSRALIPALVATVVAFLVVMAAWPEVNSLAAIGPHPERGGRFYGTTNLTATVLLTVTMQAGALLGLRRLLPLAVLALVAIGWSRAGADGGGLVVTAVALGVLALRLSGKRLTLRLAAAAVVAAVALGLALVRGRSATGRTPCSAIWVTACTSPGSGSSAPGTRRSSSRPRSAPCSCSRRAGRASPPATRSSRASSSRCSSTTRRRTLPPRARSRTASSSRGSGFAPASPRRLD